MNRNLFYNLKEIICFSLAMFLFVACAKDKGPLVKPTKSMVVAPFVDTIPTPKVYTYTISFGSNVKPIFQASCIQGCHNPSHPKLDLRPPVAYNQLVTGGASAPYVNAVTPKQSRLYLHLSGIYTLMPKGGPKLRQGKIDTIYTWISQGALNN